MNIAHLLEIDGGSVSIRQECRHIRMHDIRFCDRMNVRSYERVFSDATLSYLQTKPECKGTYSFIAAMRRAVDAFTNPQLSTQDRVCHAWYASFFLLLWCKLSQDGSAPVHLTTCCVANALTITSIADFLNTEKKGCNWGMLGSQSCEQCFRGLRALSGGSGNVSNVAFLDVVQRIRKIQFVTQFEWDKKDIIKFPQHDKRTRSPLSFFAEYDGECRIHRALEDAWHSAKTTMSQFFPGAAAVPAPHTARDGLLFDSWVDFSSSVIPASFTDSWSIAGWKGQPREEGGRDKSANDDDDEADDEDDEAQPNGQNYREIVHALYEIAAYPRSNSTRLGRFIASGKVEQ